MNDPSNQMQNQFALSPPQKALYDVLNRKDESLGRMYFGGLYALTSAANPERFSQCSQSFRELMEKLWIEYDTSLKKKGASLKQKTKALENTWRKIRWKAGQLVTAVQMSAAKLEQFCLELDGFFEWNKKFLPNRREQALRTIAKMDPMAGKLPTTIMQLRVEEYAVLRQYFEDVAHHNIQPSSDADFHSYVDALEGFLMDRLRPRSADNFSEIERLIEEGENRA